MKRDFENYQVALKLLLRKGNKTLFLKDTYNQGWDLPGGRIDNVEDKTPLEQILIRELNEEIGDGVKYTIGKSVFQYRKFFQRKTPVFVVVYEGKYISGDIKISSEHNGYDWLDMENYKFKSIDFFDKGEYEAFKNYFESK